METASSSTVGVLASWNTQRPAEQAALRPPAVLQLLEIVLIGGGSAAHGLQRAEPRAAAMETASSSTVGVLQTCLSWTHSHESHRDILLSRKEFTINGLRETMYRSAICQRVAKIISEDFTSAMLITLHCASSAAMPPDLAKRLYRAWKDTAQRIAGGPFNCIRIVDYGPHPIPEIVFFVVADLPPDICMEAGAAWYMGTASVDPLDEKGLDRIAKAVIQQTSPTKAQIWSYCKGRPHASDTPPLQ